MTLINEATIIANCTNALVITGANKVANSGTLEATGSGGLIVMSNILNSGLIWAHGGNITIDGAVTGTRSALIDGAATLEFAAASSANVTFTGTNLATLVLDNPTAFTGQILGFAAQWGGSTDQFAPTSETAAVQNTITDFAAGLDKIDIRQFGNIESLADLTEAQQGIDALIALDSHDTLLLENVNATNLNASDFIIHA
jgi:hypothetical protein